MRNEALLVILPILVTGAVIWCHVQNRIEGEEEDEAPITASTRILTREGMAAPVLELREESVQAAGIRAVSLGTGNLSRPLPLPAGSILRDQGRAWVYLALARNRFTRVEVEPDSRSEQGPWHFVGKLPTLGGPAVVVNEGAQILLSDEHKSEIQLGD